mmetsp:Transcript_100835/g.289378  ORF Transcript_100835/g.289378 Transcript_100835/m.289378 type:complete len:210 (+) Transcript_100835:1076-1705(+)
MNLMRSNTANWIARVGATLRQFAPFPFQKPLTPSSAHSSLSWYTTDAFCEPAPHICMVAITSRGDVHVRLTTPAAAPAIRNLTLLPWIRQNAPRRFETAPPVSKRASGAATSREMSSSMAAGAASTTATGSDLRAAAGPCRWWWWRRVSGSHRPNSPLLHRRRTRRAGARAAPFGARAPMAPFGGGVMACVARTVGASKPVRARRRRAF